MIKWRQDSIKQINRKKQEEKELIEKNQELEKQVTDLQLALCDVYEICVTGGVPSA